MGERCTRSRVRRLVAWVRRQRRVVIVALVVALVSGLALVGGTTYALIASRASFVERDGTSLTVDGKPFRFVGFNLYDGAASDIYSCKPSTRLDDKELAASLRYIHDVAGATVVRFWAYQTYTAGGRDFSGVDRFIAAARAAGLRVMPVLEDGPGDCSTGTPGTPLTDVADWYTEGYRKPYGSARLSLRSYAQVMAHHYRNDPTILGWTMVNEAETTQRAADGKSVLVGFARDLAGVIHRADPNHLVTLGTQGNGAPGGSGQDFADIYALPGLDFTEVHDYAFYGSDTEAMPGSQDGVLPAADSDTCRSLQAPIACSFSIAKALGKPIVVGESGIVATDEAGRQRRAELMSAKVGAAFAAGASGYLVWHLDSAPTDQLDVIPAQNDPLVGVLRAAARRYG